MQSSVVEIKSREELAQSAWYAVYTKHQHEKSATELLARKGFEVLLPLYRATHQWKDRVKNVLLPVFPCYLFLRANLERKLDILRTPGVFWLVENGGHACPVPESDIEAVRRIAQSPGQVKPHSYLKSGDRVRVRVGPLAGVQGILVRVKNGYRVVLSVDVLQKAVAVEVDISVVEPVNGARGRSLTGANDERQIA
jgi:transcription antitermination factor NusG